MAERILGATGSPKRRRFLFVPIVLVSLLAVFWVAGAQAVHDERVFELEGNAVAGNTGVGTGTDPANPQSQPAGGEDWDAVYAEEQGDPGASNAEATAFGTDTTLLNTLAGAGDSILTGGNTKDIHDLPSWLWKQTTSTSTQDKADIEHAYAAQYVVDKSEPGDQCGSIETPTEECVLLYFGADRFSNSGDTVMGFWFFKQNIAKSALDAGGNGTFIGNHTARTATARGDILVVADFRAGGKAPSIQVYEWVSSGGSASTNLDQIGGSDTPAGCTQSPPEGGQSKEPVPPVSGNDNFCATANQFVVTSPWPFLAKDNSGGTSGDGGSDTKFGIAEFMEGGINMTALGLGDQCFSSFMAETRASHSVTSTLSDFLLGTFGSCQTEVKTTPKTGAGGTLTADSDNDNLDEISIGSGSVSVTDSALLDVKGVSSFAGELKFYICGPLASGACTTGGVPAGTKTANANGTYVSDAVTLTSVGRYCWRADFTSTTSGVPPASDSTIESAGPPKSTGECFEVMPVQPSLDTAAVAAAVEIGSAAQDNATLSGTTKQPGTNGGTTPGVAGSQYPSINATDGANAGGKITFTLVNSDCTTTTTGTGTNPQDVTVNQTTDPKTYGPVGFTPSATGTYHWKAAYTPATGDPNNLTASHNSICDDTDETVKVVDARISVSPLTDVNEVNDAHTITATVEQDTGSGFVDAPDGTTVTFSLLNNTANADFVDDDNTCTTVDGECSVQINTSTAGEVDIRATSTFTVEGVSLTRTTGSGGNNSADAEKTYVDAFITLSPLTATNEVDDPHEITATVQQASGAVDENGDPVFTNAPDGTTVTFTLPNNSAGATFVGGVDSCTTTAGQCSISITTSTAGSVDIHATTTFSILGEEVTRETDGQGNNSADANKVYVDAYITIGPPEATNTVGDPHTFTINVFQDDGLPEDDANGDGVTGFGPAPDGTLVTVTLTDSGGAQHSTSEDTCDAANDDDPDDDGDPAGTVDGACTVTFTSPTAGTVTGHAAVTFDVGGVSVTRETDGEAPNSDDAVKIFVAGSIAWSKVDNAGDLQGGATFELCKTADFTLPFGPMVPLEEPLDCIDVVDNGANDGDADDGEFLVSGLSLGTYSVEETVAPDGFEKDPDKVFVELTPNDTDKEITEAFVNNREVLKITGFGYTNSATGEPTSGVVSGTATYTVDLHNYGTSAADLTNSSLVVSLGSGTGTLTCDGEGTGGLTKPITGSVAAGGDLGPIELVCTYDGMSDGAEILATLNVRSTTNNLEREASGSPATITFTVQGD